MSEAHSLYSASGADASLGPEGCVGKPAMEQGRRTSSAFADEGTAAHTLACTVLTDRIGGGNDTAVAHIGEIIKVRNYDDVARKWIERKFRVDEEMAEHVDDWIDRFMLVTQGRNVERMAEQRVYYHTYLGAPKDKAFGTCDAGAILFDQPALDWEDPRTGKVHHFPAGDELVGDDLKYGKGVEVLATTLQLKLYGAGLYWAWEPVANITRVRLRIGQPRKDHYDEIVISPAELLAAVEALKPNVPRVQNALSLAAMYREANPADSGIGLGEVLDAQGFLHPTEKACRFCDAKAICPALAAVVSESVSGKPCAPEDFEDLTVDSKADVREYGGNYLAQAYSRIGLIDAWCKAVLAEIDRRVLLLGETVPGVKVVAGKKGKREWRDAYEVEQFIKSSIPAAVQGLLFKKVMLTAPQAVAALKTSPNSLAKLSAFIVQEQGKPSVAPLADERAAISHRTTADDFEDLTEQPAPARGTAAGSARHPFR